MPTNAKPVWCPPHSVKNVKEVLEGITIGGILVSFLWADLDLKNIGREFDRYCKGLFVRKVSLVCESLNHSTDKPEFGNTVSSWIHTKRIAAVYLLVRGELTSDFVTTVNLGKEGQAWTQLDT
uniref:Uncharacterized protein n=1 Tax=Vespula pensylvanica TaxID=30213 RepID=A0A834NX84_VESPE|nr:hypothetical protein H0235_010538 [Vespula pensylvanica]